jgi:hypothetical protein
MMAGVAVALVSLGTPCYATTVPGIPPSGYSCQETFVIAAGGAIVAFFGVVLAVRGRR